MSSVKSLESRLTLTADPGPLVAGVRKAERELTKLASAVNVFGGSFVGNAALQQLMQVHRFAMEQFESMRERAVQYYGPAAAASARADAAGTKLDIASARVEGAAIAGAELVRQRLAEYDVSRVEELRAPSQAAAATASGSAVVENAYSHWWRGIESPGMLGMVSPAAYGGQQGLRLADEVTRSLGASSGGSGDAGWWERLVQAIESLTQTAEDRAAAAGGGG